MIIFYLYNGTQIARISNVCITKISSVVSALSMCFIGCFNGAIIVLDKNYELFSIFVGHHRAITSMYSLPNWMMLAASEDSTLRLWNIYTGKALTRRLSSN